MWLTKAERKSKTFTSVEDPGFFIHPGSRIPDLKTFNKREGWKKIFCHNFFLTTNLTKLKIILFLKCWRKKLGQVIKKNYRTFYPKNLTLNSKKYASGIRDPGSRKTYSGSRIRVQGSKRHRISRIRNTDIHTCEINCFYEKSQLFLNQFLLVIMSWNKKLL